jgi:glutaredoxin
VIDPSKLTVPDVVTVYGRDTCDDTTRARQHFERAGLLFHYVNLDLDPDAKAAVHGAGYFQTPVIVTPAGRIEMEPDDDELASIAMENEGGPATD